jgi:sporulation protein YlmC with PRC-barrel domain
MDMQAPTEWRASKLIGTKIMGPDDKSIGDVDEVILDKEGKVHGVVIGVGGFLGIGEKAVAVPFNALTVQRDQKGTGIEKISANYTKDQLKNAPTYKYLSDKSSSETTASGSRSATPNRGAGAPATSK